MPTFRILTFVTDRHLYDEMRRSFESGGFREPEARYQIVDNTGTNSGDPYTVVNDLLDAITEDYLVVCHQDVRLEEDASYDRLVDELVRASAQFGNWAVAGPAGLGMDYRQILAISDPWQAPKWRGPWPVEAEVLDELFLVIKPGMTRLTPGLRGFHFYAADFCIAARQSGGVALVINFPLHHLSNGETGRLSSAYLQARDALQSAWSPLFRFRLLVATTNEPVVLSRHGVLRRVAKYRKVQRVLKTLLGRRLVP